MWDRQHSRRDKTLSPVRVQIFIRLAIMKRRSGTGRILTTLILAIRSNSEAYLFVPDVIKHNHQHGENGQYPCV